MNSAGVQKVRMMITWLHCCFRKDHERRTQENIDHLQEKLQVATATLQQAIGGVTGHLSNHHEKVSKNIMPHFIMMSER